MFVLFTNKGGAMFTRIILSTLIISLLALSQNEETDSLHTIHHHEKEESEVPIVGMPSAIFAGVSMSMDGSGTGWIPASSNTSMKMFHAAEWMVMTHGNIFLRYTHQGGPRGDAQFSFPNWYMVSAQREIAENQQLKFRTMLSLDRIFDGGNGYPLLLQSGESWNGIPLIDRQHPHDLLAELSVTHSIKFTPEFGSFLYIGYPGEPAIGPTAFMHRPASQFNPDAPIGHHWQDATHITFGVATAGFVLNSVKVEGSIFTGREPDENRFNFEQMLFDSYSGRITFNPTNDLSLQTSYGFVRNPEGHGDDVYRFSGSLLYSTQFEDERSFHSSFVWGNNEDHHKFLNSYLFEFAYIVDRISFYGRHETIEKLRSDLGILLEKEKIELLRQYTVGINYHLLDIDKTELRVGLQGTLSSVSTFLVQYYGKDPKSFQLTVQIR